MRKADGRNVERDEKENNGEKTTKKNKKKKRKKNRHIHSRSKYSPSFVFHRVKLAMIQRNIQ